MGLRQASKGVESVIFNCRVKFEHNELGVLGRG